MNATGSGRVPVFASVRLFFSLFFVVFSWGWPGFVSLLSACAQASDAMADGSA